MPLKLLVAFVWFILIRLNAGAQQFDFASKPARDAKTSELIQLADAAVVKPVNEKTLNEWKAACWAMELMLYKPEGFNKRIPGIIKNLHQQPVSFQQAFLEMISTLYPGKFHRRLSLIWSKLGNQKIKAMALEQMALSGKFPDLKKDTGFMRSAYFTYYLSRWKTPMSVFPAKREFLDPDFLPGQYVLISCQYRNRDKPGCLMIRTADHEWLKDEQGELYCFTQLARAVTNLPWYITNGNTPQGLYRITGMDISNNNWIGPTPNLQLVMPFESADVPFFSDTVRSDEQYNQLLGPLKKYAALYESYFAGKTGRSEIIAHGTSIPESYYKGKTYYPCTPSLGCLCSPEIWDEEGVLVTSTQQEWMRVVSGLGKKPIYLVVVDTGQ